MRDFSEYSRYHWPILQRLEGYVWDTVSLMVRATSKATGNALEIDATVEKAFIHVGRVECSAGH